MKDRTSKWVQMTVDSKGDLSVPDLGTVPAAKLYLSHLKGERHLGPGAWSPAMQFRDNN